MGSLCGLLESVLTEAYSDEAENKIAVFTNITLRAQMDTTLDVLCTPIFSSHNFLCVDRAESSSASFFLVPDEFFYFRVTL